MIRFLLVSIVGWVAVLGVGIEAALPYIFRNTVPRASVIESPGHAPSLLRRMWPHYWLGYVLVVLVLTHASFVMGPVMGRADATGIWAATLAFCLLLLQVGLGRVLKSGTSSRRQVRRWHFWAMIAFVGLLLTHVLRNG